MAQKESGAEKEFKLESQVNGEKEARADDGLWVSAFIEALRLTSNVYMACRQAKVSRKTAYKRKEENEEFAAMWADAMEDGNDLLEWDLRKRGRATSDKAAIFLLQAHRYGFRQQHEHSGPGGKPIPVAMDVVSIIDEDDDDE
jgi:hypothetical protein